MTGKQTGCQIWRIYSNFLWIFQKDSQSVLIAVHCTLTLNCPNCGLFLFISWHPYMWYKTSSYNPQFMKMYYGEKALSLSLLSHHLFSCHIIWLLLALSLSYIHLYIIYILWLVLVIFHFSQGSANIEINGWSVAAVDFYLFVAEYKYSVF